MKVTSVSKFRKEIKRYVDEVNQDQEPLILTRSDGVSVVVTSLGAYNSYSETDYLDNVHDGPITIMFIMI